MRVSSDSCVYSEGQKHTHQVQAVTLKPSGGNLLYMTLSMALLIKQVMLMYFIRLQASEEGLYVILYIFCLLYIYYIYTFF